MLTSSFAFSQGHQKSVGHISGPLKEMLRKINHSNMVSLGESEGEREGEKRGKREGERGGRGGGERRGGREEDLVG